MDIQDFGKSWSDGRALFVLPFPAQLSGANLACFNSLALMHSQRPDLLQYELLDLSDPKINLQRAFDIAASALHVPV